jgi:hypothetical protein
VIVLLGIFFAAVVLVLWSACVLGGKSDDEAGRP